MSTSPTIKAEHYLLGIHYWAMWRPEGFVPRMEIYEYFGRQAAIGMYWFRSRRFGTTLALRLQDLNTPIFRPFLLDPKRADELIERGI